MKTFAFVLLAMITAQQVHAQEVQTQESVIEAYAGDWICSAAGYDRLGFYRSVNGFGYPAKIDAQRSALHQCTIQNLVECQVQSCRQQ